MAQELAQRTPYPVDRLVRYAAYATKAGLDVVMAYRLLIAVGPEQAEVLVASGAPIFEEALEAGVGAGQAKKCASCVLGLTGAPGVCPYWPVEMPECSGYVELPRWRQRAPVDVVRVSQASLERVRA